MYPRPAAAIEVLQTPGQAATPAALMVCPPPGANAHEICLNGGHDRYEARRPRSYRGTVCLMKQTDHMSGPV